MVRGILLAAGRGNRFGADKLMQPLTEGRSVALAAADTLINALPGSIAVCRPEQSRLIEQLLEIGFRVETCEQADRGMGFTLATAACATGEQENLLIALADMPFIELATIQQIVAALEAGAKLVQPRYHGQPGNPVGLNYSFRQRLLAPQGDFGARQLLKQRAAEITYIDLDDPGILRDIDRPEDLPGQPD